MHVIGWRFPRRLSKRRDTEKCKFCGRYIDSLYMYEHVTDNHQPLSRKTYENSKKTFK